MNVRKLELWHMKSINLFWYKIILHNKHRLTICSTRKQFILLFLLLQPGDIYYCCNLVYLKINLRWWKYFSWKSIISFVIIVATRPGKITSVALFIWSVFYFFVKFNKQCDWLFLVLIWSRWLYFLFQHEHILFILSLVMTYPKTFYKY